MWCTCCCRSLSAIAAALLFALPAAPPSLEKPRELEQCHRSNYIKNTINMEITKISKLLVWDAMLGDKTIQEHTFTVLTQSYTAVCWDPLSSLSLLLSRILPYLTSFTASSFNGLMKTRRTPALINSVLVLGSSCTVKPYTGMRGSKSFINWVAVDPSILLCPRSLSMMTKAYEFVGILFTYQLV